MSHPGRTPNAKSIADWLVQPEEARLELIDGEFVEKAAPDVDHALGQSGVVRSLGVLFHRRPGGKLPGGWWILTEVDIQLGRNGYRPDLAGWRRERVPVMPRERPVTVAPDWICEVVSGTNARNDTILKMRRYHEAGVGHYWLLDPKRGSLDVYRHEQPGYLHILTAERPEVVRAEPFHAVAVAVGVLLGDDPEDDPPAAP